MSLPERYALTELERATGLVIGSDDGAPELPRAPRGMTALGALADSIRGALERPPCLVTFSGGRDSSAVLAVAAELARREHLPPPVAVTYRFPEQMSRADESHWQEIVIGHTGVADWLRIGITDEMDCLGPIGLDALKRHGLIFPFAPHAHVPALRHCLGGSLVTGTGGDQVLGRRSRLADVLAGRAAPVPRDALRLAAALGPRGMRRARWGRRAPTFVDWLTPTGRAAFQRSWGEAMASVPVSWRKGIEQTWRSRDLQISVAAMNLLAREHDVQLVHPLFSPLFISVLARHAGVRGYADRAALMRVLFADLLPRQVIDRRTKAGFGEAVWTRHSQEFGRSWNGVGVDDELVDVDSLAAHWRRSQPPPGPTLTLLKQAWLAASGIAQGAESTSTSRPPALAS